jgi:hypothetical protein
MDNSRITALSFCGGVLFLHCFMEIFKFRMIVSATSAGCQISPFRSLSSVWQSVST